MAWLAPKILALGGFFHHLSVLPVPSWHEEPAGAGCAGIHTSEWIHHPGAFSGTSLCHGAAQPSPFSLLGVMSCLVQLFSVVWVVEGGKISCTVGHSMAGLWKRKIFLLHWGPVNSWVVEREEKISPALRATQWLGSEKRNFFSCTGWVVGG